MTNYEAEPLPRFSKAEHEMFAALGLEHLLEQNRTAMSIYYDAVETVFISGEDGPAVNALRAAAKAIRDCSDFRMSASFDRLITDQM